MRSRRLHRLEVDPLHGKDVSEHDFEVMMTQFVYALENHQCPNCQARIRFDYTGDEVILDCPQKDYHSEMGAGMLLEVGRFLAVSGEDSLLEIVTRILEEIKLQREGQR